MQKETVPLDHTRALLLAQLLEYLQAQGYRTATITGYRKSLKHFLLYLQQADIDIRELTIRHIQSYQSFLSERPLLVGSGKLSTISLRGIMSHIKGFCTFLHKTGRIYYDPSANMELPRTGRHLPRALLSVDEVVLLIKQADLSSPIGIRNRAILELMYSSGLRNRETCTLEITDVDLEGRTVFVHGKGGKDAVVPFGREAAEALEHYLYFARDKLLKERRKATRLSVKRKNAEKGSHPLFLSVLGYSMSRDAVNNFVKAYTIKAGIEKKVTPHCLRHACATHLLRNGADIRLIQRLLRHSDISSTQVYTRVAIEDIKEAQSRYHPRERHTNE